MNLSPHATSANSHMQHFQPVIALGLRHSRFNAPRVTFYHHTLCSSFWPRVVTHSHLFKNWVSFQENTFSQQMNRVSLHNNELCLVAKISGHNFNCFICGNKSCKSKVLYFNYCLNYFFFGGNGPL